MVLAMVKISSAALQVEEHAPPLLAPLEAGLRELTIRANDRSAQSRWPREETALLALSPPKEPNSPTLMPARLLIADRAAPPRGAATAETAAEESVAAIAAGPIWFRSSGSRGGEERRSRGWISGGRERGICMARPGIRLAANDWWAGKGISSQPLRKRSAFELQPRAGRGGDIPRSVLCTSKLHTSSSTAHRAFLTIDWARLPQLPKKIEDR